jgi:hypothetical protein
MKGSPGRFFKAAASGRSRIVVARRDVLSRLS